jgi:hypothetical protein
LTGSRHSSKSGSAPELGRLNRIGFCFVDASLMHCPLTSLIRIATGQMISIELPREPAKTTSVPRAIGKGQYRTASFGQDPGTSRKNTIWLTRRPESQRLLARRKASGY